MSWFKSKNAQAAACNDLIFKEEQKPLLNLQRTVDELKAVAEAARARGDAEGADLFQKEADGLASRLAAISSHCSRRAFERVNESTVNVFKIDLHAQLPTQAIQVVHETLLDMQKRTSTYTVKTEVHVVTGAGNHSVNGVAKVKQAVEEYLKFQGVQYADAPGNAGMLVLPVSKAFKVSEISGDTCKFAAKKGHLEVLKWARANGAPWHEWTCAGAAANGHLDVLKWVRANGAPWSKYTSLEAARNGHLDTLTWAVYNGAPYDPRACIHASYENDNDNGILIMEWLYAHGGEPDE